MARLPADFRLYALRADSGFFVTEFLVELERRALPYAIAVRMNPHLRRTVAGIKQWTPFARGLEAAETSYQAYGWQAPRRLVVVRETIRERPEARGRKLLEVPGYTFHVLVTTLRHDPVQTWRFYNSRAECENRIKELKEDFGAGGFCLHSFDGTEAAFRLICFLFNLIADFKREVTHNEAPRLMTLRSRLFVIGAIRGADGRQQVLRLGLRGRWRKRFAALLERIAALAVSTVAQFAPDQKILFPCLGNRLRHASNHPYFQLPTEIFGFNRRETKSGWTDPESRSRTATYIVEMVGRFYAVSQRFSLEHDRRNPPESTVIEQLATVLNVCADVFHFYANRISDEIKCDFDQCGLDNNVIDGTYCAFRDVLAQHRGMEPLLQRHPRKLNG